MSILRSSLLAGAAVAVLSSVMSGDAAAASATTFATDNCNGALPGYEGALRKRPLGILNEGTTHAFVSCGVTVDEHNTTGINNAAVFLINRGAATQAVTCTFIDGLPPEFNGIDPDLPLPTYRTKAVAVLPGALMPIQWAPIEYGVQQFSTYGAFNCNLPPDMEISIAAAAWSPPEP